MALEAIDRLPILFRHERHHGSGCPGSTGSPGAVDEVFDVAGRVVVDDGLDTLDVDTACSDVSGDQGAGLAFGECGESAVPLVLGATAVHGYRFHARRGDVPLFPFGFGLSYTSFAHGRPILSGGAAPTARITVRNSGARAGGDVVQLYLVSTPAGPTRRLAGFAKVELAPGEAREVTIDAEPRIIADHRDGAWRLAAGRYGFAIGRSAAELGPTSFVTLARRQWSDRAARTGPRDDR